MEVESLLYEVGDVGDTIALNRADRLIGVGSPMTSEGDAGGGPHPFKEEPQTAEAVPVSEPQEEEPMSTTLGTGPPGVGRHSIRTPLSAEAEG